MNRLCRLEVKGFKSIRDSRALEFGPLNVIIGPNGAGKSNLVALFRLLSWMTASPGNLQLHVSRVGGANTLLHDGAAKTPQLEIQLAVATDAGSNEYAARLFHAAPDTLIFAEEKYRFPRRGFPNVAPWLSLGSGHKESGLLQVRDDDQTARVILSLMRYFKVYQFHNTSETARMKTRWSIDDSRFLKEDAANLAPFLYRLYGQQPAHYRRIVETIRQGAPFFGDCVRAAERHTAVAVVRAQHRHRLRPSSGL